MLNTNFSSLNATNNLQCFLVLLSTRPSWGPEGLSTRELSKKMLREWFGGDRSLLILLVRDLNRTEIMTSSRARRKLKDAVAKRIARKLNSALGTEEGVDATTLLAVKELGKHLSRGKGIAGSLRMYIMPVMVVIVLIYIFMRNQSVRIPRKRWERMDGMAGVSPISGLHGMDCMGGRDGIDPRKDMLARAATVARNQPAESQSDLKNEISLIGEEQAVLASHDQVVGEAGGPAHQSDDLSTSDFEDVVDEVEDATNEMRQAQTRVGLSAHLRSLAAVRVRAAHSE
ncbi:MAG: hypothetical protein SGPRY_014187 [Prymnesium sp.]